MSTSTHRTKLKKKLKLKNVFNIPQLSHTQSGVFNISPSRRKNSSTNHFFSKQNTNRNKSNQLQMNDLHYTGHNNSSTNCIYIDNLYL